MKPSGPKTFGFIFALVGVISVVALVMFVMDSNKAPVAGPGQNVQAPQQRPAVAEPRGGRQAGTGQPRQPGDPAGARTGGGTQGTGPSSMQRPRQEPAASGNKPGIDWTSNKRAEKPGQDQGRNSHAELGSHTSGAVEWTKKLSPNALLNRPLGSLVLPEIKDRPVRIALLGNAAAQEILLILQAQLSTRENLAFVDREQLAKVMDQQALMAAIGSEGLGDKIKLGRLLGADVLLSISADPGLPGQLRVGVSEARMGLTLGRLNVSTKDSADDVAQRLALLVDRALGQLGRPIDQLVAVPHTISSGVDLENRDLVYAISRLIEAKLTSNAGVLGVEIKDAGSMVSEAGLPTVEVAGVKTRPLPLYFTSTLRQEPDKALFVVGLKVQQADRVVGTWSSEPVSREQLPGSVGELVAKAFASENLKLVAGDPAFEEMQLLNQVRGYYMLGEYESALETVNALLLIQPEDGYRILALDLIRKVIDARYDAGAPYEEFEKNARSAIDLWIQGRRYADPMTNKYRTYTFEMDGKKANIWRTDCVNGWAGAMSRYRLDPRVMGKTNVVASWYVNEVEPIQRQLAREFGVYTPPLWDLQGKTEYRFGLNTVYDRLPQTALWSDAPSRLEKLEIQWHDSMNNPYLIQPTGWIKAGAKTDFVWERHSRHTCYLIKDGVVSVPFELPTSPVRLDGSQTSEGVYWASYDGAGIWIPVVSDDPMVYVLDPKTGKTTVFTKADGLGPMDRMASAAGFAPGKAIIAGSYKVEGKTAQFWAALLTVDEAGKKQVKMITKLAGVTNLFTQKAGASELAFDPGWSICTPDAGAPEAWKVSFSTGANGLFTVNTRDMSYKVEPGVDVNNPAFPPCLTSDAQVVRGQAAPNHHFYISILNRLDSTTRIIRTLTDYHSFVQYKGALVGIERQGGLGVLYNQEQTIVPLLGEAFPTPDSLLWDSANFGPLLLMTERPGSVYTAFKLKLPELDPAPQPSRADPAKDVILDVRLWENPILTLSPTGVKVGTDLDENRSNTVESNFLAPQNWLQLRIDGTTVSFPGRTIVDNQGHLELGVQYNYPLPMIDKRRIEILSVASNPADLEKPGMNVIDYTKAKYVAMPVHYIRGDLPGATVLVIRSGADKDWVRFKIHGIKKDTGPDAGTAQGAQKPTWESLPVTMRNHFIGEFDLPQGYDKDLWINCQQDKATYDSNADHIINPDGQMWLMATTPWVVTGGRFNLKIPRQAVGVPGKYIFVQHTWHRYLSGDPNKAPDADIHREVMREPGFKRWDQPPVVLVPYKGPDGKERMLRIDTTKEGRLNFAARNSNTYWVDKELAGSDNLGSMEEGRGIALGLAGSPAVADALIKAGLPVDFATPVTGTTVAHTLAMEGQVETLAYLVDKHGLNLQALDKAGNSAFHYAAAPRGDGPKSEAMLRFLSERKLDINLKNSEGQTPLLVFAGKNRGIRYKDMPKLFLDLGADKNITDNSGKTAMEITPSKFIREVLESGQTPDLATFGKFGQPVQATTRPEEP